MSRKKKRIIIKKENDLFAIDNNEYFSNFLNISFDIYRKTINAISQNEGLLIHISPKFQTILLKIEKYFADDVIKFEQWELETLIDWVDCMCIIILSAPEEWEPFLENDEPNETINIFIQLSEEFIQQSKKILNHDMRQKKPN